jgi:3-deoxy-D-manno-octulosonic acid (KDO) 8-phosphate synthase
MIDDAVMVVGISVLAVVVMVVPVGMGVIAMEVLVDVPMPIVMGVTHVMGGRGAQRGQGDGHREQDHQFERANTHRSQV